MQLGRNQPDRPLSSAHGLQVWSSFRQRQLAQPAPRSHSPLGSSDWHEAEKGGWRVAGLISRTGPSLLGPSVQAVASCLRSTLQEDQHRVSGCLEVSCRTAPMTASAKPTLIPTEGNIQWLLLRRLGVAYVKVLLVACLACKGTFPRSPSPQRTPMLWFLTHCNQTWHQLLSGESLLSGG